MWTTPWAVGGGAEITASIGRLLAYVGTSGREGVVGTGDLKVQALATPGTKIRVAPGSGVIRNRYPNARAQSYIVDNPSQHEVPVTQTPSGQPRTDLVIARIVDPQYGGTQPTDPNNYSYVITDIIEGVPADAGHAYVRNLGYPAIALARIAIPGGTATITNAMITNLRRVANPNREREIFGDNLEGSAIYALDSTVETYWPQLPDPVARIYVPEWATVAVIKATWDGVRVSRSAATGVIYARIGFGGLQARTQDQKWALDFSALPNEEMRESWSVSDTIAIPEAMRGTEQPLRLLGKRLTNGGPPRMDNASSYSFDVEFKEVAA